MASKREKGADYEARFGFTSNYTVNLDSALRLPVPSKFRDVLENVYPECSDQLVVVPDQGKLRVFPCSTWFKAQERLEALSQFDPKANAVTSYLMGHMLKAPIDGQSRIRLNPYLVGVAGLTKEVVVVGQGDRMELWDAAKWATFSAGMDQNLWTTMAEVFR